jgi:hypothetical protein
MSLADDSRASVAGCKPSGAAEATAGQLPLVGDPYVAARHAIGRLLDLVSVVKCRQRALVDGRSWFVPMTTLWWVDGERFLGRLAIRHRLTPALEKAGGHIGYDVRPIQSPRSSQAGLHAD